MKRRDFITLLGGAAAAWPLAARAQQPGKLPIIGLLVADMPSARQQLVGAFVQRLRELGWIEDRTVTIEYRWAAGNNERLAEIAAEFVRLNVDVMVLELTMRLAELPDIPTVGEFVPGFETSAWGGIGAPRETPTEIIDKLNREINAALTDPKVKARFADLGGTVLALSPAEYGKRIAQETEKWGKVIKFSGAKAD